jgi:hypothetical protein
MPGPLTLLGATATEKKIVVDFVISSGSFSIEDSRRCALQTNNNSRICIINKDMPAETISLPSEIGATIPSLSNILPIGISLMLDVCVGSHKS